MKKHITLILTALLAAISCTQFDDSAIWEELLDHRERIEKLEAECNRLNSNIEAMQAVLEALQTNDYVTGVTKIMEDGVEVGYSITFAKGGTITIYHGTDGSDGSTPKIGIKKASDGQYYWTSGDDWLLDDNGNRIPATVSDPDANYITPQFRIVDGVWYISYDNGNSWREMESGEEEAPLFSGVEVTADYIVFTMADGTQFMIPTWKAFEDTQRVVGQVNANLKSLRTIACVLEGDDYATYVTPMLENGLLIGYLVNLSKNDPITIYQIADQTEVPDISIGKDKDGYFYWTIDSQWLKDAKGDKIRVNGESPAPQLNVDGGNWYISYDNYETWRELQTVSKKGSTVFFKKVMWDSEYVCMVLADDSKVVIPFIKVISNHWAGKTWYAYGTSLTSKSQGKYVPYVAEMGGLNVVNKGIGGGGIITNTKIRDAVMNTTDGKLAADLITLEVGANDSSSPLGDPLDNTADTFLGSLTQCINYLLQNTNAQIVVMSSTIGKYKLSGGSTEVTEENSKFLERCKGIREVCLKCGVYYIGLADEAGMGWARLNNNMGVDYTTDNIHHTDIGGYNLALYVWSKLKDIPCWYTSVPDEDETPSYEGGSHIVDKSWVAEAVTGLPKDTIAASLLGAQYFYVSDSESIDYMAGKSIEAMWFSVATKGSNETHPGGDVNIYLVDPSSPDPTAWTLVKTVTVPPLPVLTFKEMAFDAPFEVPAGYTIGWQSSAMVIGHTKNASKQPIAVSHFPCKYYDRKDSTTSTDIILTGIDFKIVQ